MQITDRTAIDEERERIDVVPDSVDDLWHLQYIIESGDRVAGDTHRRIQRHDEHMRDTGGQREHLWAALAVEDVEFDRHANRLRIGGEIVACSREDQVGFHHTINVDVHDEVSIEKRFSIDQRERLDAAVAAAADPDVAIVTIEEGHATVFGVNQSGPEELSTISGPTGKGEFAQARGAFFDEVATVVERLDVDRIVIAGPGFTKEDAVDAIIAARPDLGERVTVVDTSAAGMRGVREVFERGVLDEVRSAERIGAEAACVDEIMRRLATDEPATYGIDAIAAAADYGAVERLAIVDDRLRRERSADGDWSTDPEHVIRQVEQQGGDVIVISSEHDPGRQLENLGGIAAILRYAIE